MNKTRRLFVGLPLSPALRKRLVKEMLAWPKEAVLQTHPDNLHVTLFFLGFVLEEQIPAVCATVGQAVRGLASFELSFSGIELVDEESPRMIWLKGEPSNELRKLHEALEKAFAAFTVSKKNFRPHITLAKIKKSKWHKLTSKPALRAALRLVEPIDTVSVFESLSIQGKRRYDAIDTFPLQ